MSVLKSLLCLVLILALPVQAALTGKVLRVIDGDTVVLLTVSQQKVWFRLADIDAPEKGQPFGQRSRQYLTSRIIGKIVAVTGDGLDSYGRLLGTLWIDGQDINAAMVCNGMAWAYHARNVALNLAYQQCEDNARMQKWGLWQDVSAVPPWQWRKQPRPGV